MVVLLWIFVDSWLLVLEWRVQSYARVCGARSFLRHLRHRHLKQLPLFSARPIAPCVSWFGQRHETACVLDTESLDCIRPNQSMQFSWFSSLVVCGTHPFLFCSGVCPSHYWAFWYDLLLRHELVPSLRCQALSLLHQLQHDLFC